MQANRREFLRKVGCLTAAGAVIDAAAEPADAFARLQAGPDAIGVLVDTTACVGCRLCEFACQKANHLPTGTLESYGDQSVFKEKRRPSPTSLTVVNEWRPQANGGNPVYVKVNCMHCNHPACASACIVGAMQKRDNGAVTYDSWRCIGCRYCMVACPFQIPAYTYDNPLTPVVRKCQLCFQERTSKGLQPACVEACPREALVFGKRSELVKLAHETIQKYPKQYVNQVYGEHEVGGTSWMYLANVPFEQLGFLKLGGTAPPETTEAIQHGLFRFGAGPFALAALLSGITLLTRPRKKVRSVSLPVLPSRPAVSLAAFPQVSGEVVARAASGGSVALTTAPVVSARFDESFARHLDPLRFPIVPAHPHKRHHGHDEVPQPVDRKLLTPGVFVLILIALAGLACAVWRFGWGFASSTNLDQQHPWGLWVGIDVASGVALAAGGFAAAALTAVFHRENYRAVFRPALLTAMLGYTAVVTGLQADLGRYYNVWHPLVPTMWQGNSVLFEVGTCEFICLNLLYLQFAPILFEWFDRHPKRLRWVAKHARRATPILNRLMPAMIIVGCIAALFHQSALGNLLVIAPYKLHPLWHTPVLSALFLVSAIGAGGFAMMCWESLFASWCLKLKPEMHVLSKLARFIPPIMGLYLAGKIADMIVRKSYVYLMHVNAMSVCWGIEVVLGVLVPVLMLLSRRVRNSPRLLFVAATLLVGGLIFNRVNVFIVGFHPPYGKTYVPSIGEFGITLGLIAGLMLGYRVIVTYFPVISQPKREGAAA